MFSIEIEGADFRLKLKNEDRALEKAGAAMVETMRGHLAAGVDESGAAIAPAADKGAGRPLERTGELAGSITAVVAGGTVTAGPTGDRQKVAQVLAQPGKTKHRPARNPFALSERELDQAVDAYAETLELELVGK